MSDLIARVTQHSILAELDPHFLLPNPQSFSSRLAVDRVARCLERGMHIHGSCTAILPEYAILAVQRLRLHWEQGAPETLCASYRYADLVARVCDL